MEIVSYFELRFGLEQFFALRKSSHMLLGAKRGNLGKIPSSLMGEE
jgi:hypothetical protein